MCTLGAMAWRVYSWPRRTVPPSPFDTSRSTSRGARLLRALLLLYAFALPSAGTAQALTPTIGGTRQELEAEAADADRQASIERDHEKRAALVSRAELLRERLRDGDFQQGDQITLTVRGDSALSHTFTVLPGRVLSLPVIGDVSLTGVLRSELEDRVRTEVARFIRNPVVTAVSLIQVGVLGDVRSPGFYRISSNTSISDALMTAGGLAPSADLGRTIVRRGSTEITKKGSLEAVIAHGITIDAFGLRSGDVIVVGSRPARNMTLVLQSVAALVGVAVGVIALTRH